MHNRIFEENKELRIVLDALPTMVFLLDDKLRVHFANQGAGRFLGQSAGRMNDRLCGETLRCVNIAGSQKCCGETEHCSACVVRNTVYRAFEGKSALREECRMALEMEGKEKQVVLLVSASPIDLEGGRYCLVALEDVTELQALKGLLPICSECKNIRDEKGGWVILEKYIEKNSHAEFTHGICPSCLKKLYPDLK